MTAAFTRVLHERPDGPHAAPPPEASPPKDRHWRNSGFVHVERILVEEAAKCSESDALTRRPPSPATRPGAYLSSCGRHREAGCAGETEYVGAAGGGEAVVCEEPFGLQDDPFDDVRLRGAAGGLLYRSGEGAGRVSQRTGVVAGVVMLPEVRFHAGAEQSERLRGEPCFGVRRVQPGDERGEQDFGQLCPGVTGRGGCFEEEMAARRVDEGPVGVGDAPVRGRVRGGGQFSGRVGDRRCRHEQHEMPCHIGDFIPPVHRAGRNPHRGPVFERVAWKSTATGPGPASMTARTWKSARCVPPSFSSRRRPNVIVSTEAAGRPAGWQVRAHCPAGGARNGRPGARRPHSAGPDSRTGVRAGGRVVPRSDGRPHRRLQRAPPDMKRADRTSCDEYRFASSHEGDTHLPPSSGRSPGSTSARTSPRADASPPGAARRTSWQAIPST